MRTEVFLVILLAAIYPLSALSTELKNINFYQSGETSILEILLDKEDIPVKKFHVTQDKQIIIDLEGVTATERVLRSFDTSEFSGSVVFVSAYPKPNDEKNLRVAVQLRDNARSALKRTDKKILLTVENRFGVFDQMTVEDNMSYEEKINDLDMGKIHIPKSESVEDILENLTMSGKKKYIGKKITLNVKNMLVEDILKMIADASGFNIIIPEEVKNLPPLTLNLTKIPWDQALDTILSLNKLIAKKNGIILMITTLATATAEKKLEIEARKIAQKEEPIVTKIFPISYATIAEMSPIVKEYLTPERGSISLDARTNSLIVRDTIEIIEKLKKIIEVLDTQTPQVLIQAKIIEVREEHRKEIGFTNGLSFGYDPVGVVSGSTGPGFSFSSAPTALSPSMLGLNISNFSRLFDLDFRLSMMESESKGKIISSPKVITQDKKTATIETTDTTSFKVESGTGESKTTSFEETAASLSLKVTPQITAEGSISLEINLAKEAFGDRPSPEAPPEKASRTVSTNVLVDNGSTIVIGGIYNFEKSESHSGVPFLQDIPLLGWLFRTPFNPLNKKNEMIIFLTPRIINQEEAGLLANSSI